LLSSSTRIGKRPCNSGIKSLGLETWKAPAPINSMCFIDEIDKVATNNSNSGQDVSRQGVQRDILPILEGSMIQIEIIDC
jgi:hypothetical protein